MFSSLTGGKGRVQAEGGVVEGHGHVPGQVQAWAPVKPVEVIQGQGPGHLPGPVRPEVEKDHPVSVPDEPHGLGRLVP